MARTRRAWLLSKSMLDIIEQLPDGTREKAALILFEYGLNCTHETCSDELMAILRPMKGSIDEERLRYINKTVINNYSRAISRMSIQNNSEKDKKRYEEMQEGLKRAFSEVTNHHVNNVWHLIYEFIGIDAFLELKPAQYTNDKERSLYEILISEKTSSQPVMARPAEIKIDPAYYKIRE
jgi:hypothetical protein